MTPFQMAVFALACFMIGLSKGGLGGPLPITLILPMLAFFMDDMTQVIVLMLPFLLFGDWFALRAYWKQWDMDYVKLMLPTGLIGAIIGGVLLSIISDDLLKVIIGVSTLIVILYKLLSDRLENIQYKPQKWHGYLAGLVSAFASTLANAGGPPFTVYMLLQGVKPIPFIATTALYFTIINTIKIPIFWSQGLVDLSLFLSVIWMLPIIPLGVWIGRRSLNYISQTLFERIMLVLLTVSVIFLFTDVLLGL